MVPSYLDAGDVLSLCAALNDGAAARHFLAGARASGPSLEALERCALAPYLSPAVERGARGLLPTFTLAALPASELGASLRTALSR